MEILKWYSIGIIGLALILAFIFIIIDSELDERIKSLVSFIIYIPILIYLILK